MKLLKWGLLLPVIALLVAIAFCEANKAYWDAKVDEFCSRDGGVIIYEKVAANKSIYPMLKAISTGQPIIPSYEHAHADAPFYTTSKTNFLKHGWVTVMRHEQTIIRRSDRKILSKIISYGRAGGDFPTGFHPSHYSCRETGKNIKEFATTVTFTE